MPKFTRRFSISLRLRIVNRPAAGNETAAEHTLPPVVEQLPVAHDIATVVAFVGHHHDDGIARHVIQPVPRRPGRNRAGPDSGAAPARHARRQTLAESAMSRRVLPSSTTTIS